MYSYLFVAIAVFILIAVIGFGALIIIATSKVSFPKRNVHFRFHTHTSLNKSQSHYLE